MIPHTLHAPPRHCWYKFKRLSRQFAQNHYWEYIPVFPEVGSMIVSPGFSVPARSASSTILKAILSLTLPPALKNSHFATKMNKHISSRRYCSNNKFLQQQSSKQKYVNQDGLSCNQHCWLTIHQCFPDVKYNYKTKLDEYLQTSHCTPSSAGIVFSFTIGVLPTACRTLSIILGLSFLQYHP